MFIDEKIFVMPDIPILIASRIKIMASAIDGLFGVGELRNAYKDKPTNKAKEDNDSFPAIIFLQKRCNEVSST
tara:strand:+ start:288 stop:506 length:219 start_codon:yes stop_codon:yes gene_type:complete